MAVDEWTISTGSHVPAELWLGEARRLRKLMDVIATHVGGAYGAPLCWQSEDMTADQWADLDAIAAEMVRNRRHEDFGKLMESIGSGGVVLGSLENLPNVLANLRWHAGALDEWSFTAVVKFYTRYPASRVVHGRCMNTRSRGWSPWSVGLSR
ncbi:hypothetical protein [Rhizohabitans arisaemae]|uniref:hypothetical protein n=1 Tax=Rhizohabitans arisaemae TaxID=2720610 RepID=UPI0024B091B6|nr:hypothetical protein [Rhizohabitans arisaemae]